MLKWIIFCTFAFFLIINSISYENFAKGELSASLWIPDQVLHKEKSYGLIILDTIMDSDSKFDIVTDNEEVIRLKTETVNIPKGKHHGIIEFDTKGIGDAKIFAIFQDTLLEGSVNVVESAATQTQLDMILPSNLVNILVDDNKNYGYVFLLNDFDNPVRATKPILVELTSNGEITLPKKSVTIEPGNHYSKFIFQAMGEGTISATAANLIPDEEEITLDDPDEIELKLAIAPDPIPTDSSGEIYFWLERDGRPYIVPHDVKVIISIDKSFNLSFDSAIQGAIILTPNSISERKTTDTSNAEVITRTDVQLAQDSEQELIIKKGQHYGKLQVFSSFDSSGDITISGLATSINPNPDDELIKTSNLLSISTETSNFEIATETQILALPNPAYDKVEIIVSSRSDNGPVIERDDEEFTVFTNNKLKQKFDNPKVIKTDKNYAIVDADVIDFGELKIFAERNEASSDEITISSKGKYVKDPDLEITTLPILYDTKQDLFLVTLSHDKIITNVNAKQNGNLVSITSRPTFDFTTTQDSESVIVVTGKIAELLESDPVIHIASNAFTASETLDIYNPERKKLESMHPTSVYPHEPFPIINYITDLEKNLVNKAILKVSSIANMSRTNDLVYFNQTGKHEIIFYENNAVPIESIITVKDSIPNKTVEQIEAEKRRTIITYDLDVENGQGSGTYEEGTEVTISADATTDDYFVVKNKLIGWEDLPYTQPTVTFEIDDDIQTEPIYEYDFSLLLVIVGPIGGIGIFVVVKNKKNKTEESEKPDEDDILKKLLED